MDENRDKMSRGRAPGKTTGLYQAWREVLVVFLLLAAAIVGLVALATAPAAPRVAKSTPTTGSSREAIGHDALLVGVCAFAVIVFEMGRALLATCGIAW